MIAILMNRNELHQVLQ
jgi:hypothetical protein